MSPSDPISLQPLIDQFDRVLEEVTAADVPRELEARRTSVIETLTGARDIVRALCPRGGGAYEYYVLPHGMAEDD